MYFTYLLYIENIKLSQFKLIYNIHFSVNIYCYTYYIKCIMFYI